MIYFNYSCYCFIFKITVEKKNAAVQKAQNAAKAAKVGTFTRVKKFRTSTRFTRNKPLSVAGVKKYVRTPIPNKQVLHKYAVIKAPLFTDSSMKSIETANTLTFLCDPRANKNQIRNAVKAIYNVDVASVNTLIRPDGQKKAFCRLHADVEAINVANAAGLI